MLSSNADMSSSGASEGGDAAAKAQAYRALIADVYELAAVSRRISETDAAARGVTVAQWHVLSVLSGGDATVPQIAARLGLTRQAVQRVAGELVGAGSAVRHDNPEHARSSLYRATEAGLGMLDQLIADTDAPRAEAVSAVSLDELRAARNTLRAVLTGLGGG
ncbi:MarR family winged helix-turn-helix transcriptional regulator [Prauserella halophila]|uniref:MarR family winged helix-turn-helix transcriptional regulator n=1 Tax=Prauserella halophila TaxID=185641 RepID=A0ABN1WBY4_9PSEU|nr:MarR family winged helix-turn-helix transcriptional regulator [Prauserella halophila]MCP2235122.1 DNA-binding transcriptional regulator, MarR family [Prauserella halophila]